jgi:hypothetical protein
MLDKAQMGGLTAAEFIAAQPELVTNGTFDTDSDWTKQTGWAIASGVATGTALGGSVRISQAITTVVGRLYRVTYTVSAHSGTGFSLFWGNADPPGTAGAFYAAPGTFTDSFVATATTTYVGVGSRGGGPTTITLDDVSVKELPGYHATAPSDAARPILRDVTGTYALDFDGVDDAFAWTTPAITDGTWVALTRNGSYAASAAYSAGTYTMPIYQPFDLCAILWTSADLTTVQEAIVLAEGTARGAAADFGGVTNFYNAWRNRTDLRDFPVIDTSSGIDFTEAWRSCTRLTSFPLLDTSIGLTFIGAWYGCSSLTSFPELDFSSATSFQGGWRDCTSLTTFPANMFDSVTATNFTNAFLSTNLTQTSIDNILVSINTAGTSSGTFGQSGGSAPSATGEAAIDDLVSRGWTVTVTGGYVARTILTRSGQAVFDRFGSYIKERAV